MLTVGLVHGELTTLLWGGAFAFVWAYTVAARTLASLPGPVRNPRGTLTALAGTALVFRTDAVPVPPAFFSWYLVVEGSHSPSRQFARRVPLSGPETTVDLDLFRGRYEVEARWELTDSFGFTRTGPRTRWTAEVTVEPLATGFVPPPPPPTRAGTWQPRRSGRRAGDPFDVRKYVAGDDLRRLHWSLYAHSGIPFVRTADPSPPPTGHQFLVLDTEATDEEELDGRLSALVSWLEDLETRGTRWTLTIPAEGLTLESGAPVGTELAGLVPAVLPGGPIPAAWPSVVTLVTGPGSRGADQLGRALGISRRSYDPVVIAPPPRTASPAPAWWSRR